MHRSVASMDVGGTNTTDIELTPENGVLDENCGASIFIVLTKSDTNEVPEDLDNLQYHVRQFCLRHGAALVRKCMKFTDYQTLFH